MEIVKLNPTLGESLAAKTDWLAAVLEACFNLHFGLGAAVGVFSKKHCPPPTCTRPPMPTPSTPGTYAAPSTEAVAEEKFSLAADVNFEEFAEKYQLTGGAILNVLCYCVLLGLRHRRPITLGELPLGIQRELIQEGKTT